MVSTLVSIRELYSRDSDLKPDDVKALLEWSQRQPHLPQITESQAALFLHSTYYQMEGSKEALDNYFTVRTRSPHIFDCATENTIRTTLSAAFIHILPKQTPEGYDVLLIKLIDTRPETYKCINHTKLLCMILALHLHQNGFSNGLVLLFDMKGSSFRHLLKLELNVVLEQMFYVQKGLPVRIKGMHFVNVNFITQKFVSFVKPFMNKELVNMMKFHKHHVDLHKHIPKECLPEECDGECSTIKTLNERQITNILNNLDFFEWHDSQKVNESMRIRNNVVQ